MNSPLADAGDLSMNVLVYRIVASTIFPGMAFMYSSDWSRGWRQISDTAVFSMFHQMPNYVWSSKQMKVTMINVFEKTGLDKQLITLEISQTIDG